MKKAIVITAISVFIFFVASFLGCSKDPSLDSDPDVTEPVSFVVPQGWPQSAYNFQDNKLTQAGFELGRKLFYDVRLSRDNTISCASCHAQFAAFSHLDHALSHGINGLFGNRNGPGLFNMAWKPAYFWDGEVLNIEDQPIHPIENPVEMDEKAGSLVNELKTYHEYNQFFKNAFGDETIDFQRISKALAQFMGAIVSANSRYDKYIRRESGSDMTDQELHGLELFRAKCAVCHKEPLFTDYSFRNNGLSADIGLKDSGRARITHDAADLYRFMVPSLRNVDLTRPYMHDGRFTTLDAVLEHYRTGIVGSRTLDTVLSVGIQMTDGEKIDIIAFLKTLSDNTIVKDKRFSEPR